MTYPSRPIRVLLLLCAVLMHAGLLIAQDTSILSAEAYIRQAPFEMSLPQQPRIPNRWMDIRDFGAVGNGLFLNTQLIQKAIDSCHTAGGGHVRIPQGLWLTGPLELKSQVDLHLDRGALVIFTKDHSQYPMIPSGPGSKRYTVASPLYGYNLEDVAITGSGIFDGGGDSWRPVKKDKCTPSQWKALLDAGGALSSDGKVWWPTREAMDGEAYLKHLFARNIVPPAAAYLPARDFLRPYMLYLQHCRRVLLEGVTLRNSPKFVVYPNHCEDLTLNDVQVHNEWWAQNGDGIDISACRKVLVYNCDVSVGDDGICMKSSGDASEGPALDQVVIAGCHVHHAHGGFVVGSNTDGGITRVFVTDCDFVGTDVGIRMKSNYGRGGLVRGITMRHIYMRDIQHEAILFDTHYANLAAGSKSDDLINPSSPKVPLFQDLVFDSIYCEGAAIAIRVDGLSHVPVSGMHLSHMVIQADQGAMLRHASQFELKDVTVIPREGPAFRSEDVTGIHIQGGRLPASTQVFYLAGPGSRDIQLQVSGLHPGSLQVQHAGDAEVQILP